MADTATDVQDSSADAVTTDTSLRDVLATDMDVGDVSTPDADAAVSAACQDDTQTVFALRPGTSLVSSGQLSRSFRHETPSGATTTPVQVGGGLEFNGTSMLIGPDALGGDVLPILQRSGQFTIEVYFETDSSMAAPADQPARIFSWSNGVCRRNFTFAEDLSTADVDYDVRVREAGGSGDLNSEIYPYTVSADDAAGHLAMRYDGTWLSYFHNGTSIGAHKVDALMLDSWDIEHLFVFGNEVFGNAICGDYNRAWHGRIYYAAVHDTALSDSALSERATCLSELYK